MKQIRLLLVAFFLLFFSVTLFADGKKVYVPSSFGNSDLNDTSSQWCYQRSVETDNFILFWEAGYGTNPATTANSSYRVNPTTVLDVAEKSFKYYRDVLKFVHIGNSKTDSLKMIILLFYSTEWMASGSGIDDMIGLLNLSANAAKAGGHTIAHEVGHCFQYQVHCDGFTGGWMYGFGSAGSGGNGWWEQCAQWQAFKVYPDIQFSNYQFSNYLENTHKHILHETPRYANYFIQDYWVNLHGIDFIGRMWQESKYAEDPVEAYQRITNISQEQFNDEMYDCAARFVTWDVPGIKREGFDYIDARASDNYNLNNDQYWQINSNDCLENYGYNTMRLNIPTDNDTINVFFDGLSGTSGYRKLRYFAAEWRYGFVALLENNLRVYSPMFTSKYDYEGEGNPSDTATFVCPDNCKRLWLVVSGAPAVHWKHAWDDDDSNDEQWPYQVKFENTNKYGVFDFESSEAPRDIAIKQTVYQLPNRTTEATYPSTAVQPNWEQICNAFKLQLSEVKNKFDSQIKYCAIEPNGNLNYNSTANYPGNWFSKSGSVINWGSSSYIFSEFDANSLVFNIGQYPNRCSVGDTYTIRQGLVYTPQGGSSVKAQIEFTIEIVSSIDTKAGGITKGNSQIIKNSMVEDILYLNKKCSLVSIYTPQGKLIHSSHDVKSISLTDLPKGNYIVRTDGITERILKK